MLGLSFAFGVLLVLPIGSADMPVVMSLLNSYAGLAAAATGFVLGNTSHYRGHARRFLGLHPFAPDVPRDESFHHECFVRRVRQRFARHGAGRAGHNARSGSRRRGGAVSLRKQSCFVPGYGLATAQAQHAVRELATVLENRGVTVKYGIHPVAGRMPGHMNVLLAEANVPYSQLYELEQINPDLTSTDVAVVIGANDVVNPDARDNPGSPIAACQLSKSIARSPSLF